MGLSDKSGKIGVIFGLPFPEVTIEKQGPDLLFHLQQPKEEQKIMKQWSLYIGHQTTKDGNP